MCDCGLTRKVLAKTFIGVQLSQVCSSHRCAALTGVQFSYGIHIIGVQLSQGMHLQVLKMEKKNLEIFFLGKPPYTQPYTPESMLLAYV